MNQPSLWMDIAGYMLGQDEAAEEEEERRISSPGWRTANEYR